ncbi:MAG: Yip1 family protein [Planctomycetota bacterium]|nr:Yip1 family protein [Planctomycetota bacterium]
MRCRACNYPLFGIRERTCPECGTGFAPSQFDFHQSAVKFCCPHCGQDYYGMDERGHLVPRAFACVQCAAPIEMDQMVIEPTAGVKDEQTLRELMPWTDKNVPRGFKKLFGQIGWGMARPTDLGTALSRGEVRAMPSLLFALLLAWASGLTFLPIVLMSGLGRSWDRMVQEALEGLAWYVVGGAILMGGLILVWSAIAHAVLMIGNRQRRGFGVTLAATAYCSAPCVIMVVPCLGIYMFPIAGVWWTVALRKALRTAHGCSMTRAGLAAWALPLANLLLIAGVIAYWVFPAAADIFGRAGSATVTAPAAPTRGGAAARGGAPATGSTSGAAPAADVTTTEDAKPSEQPAEQTEGVQNETSEKKPGPEETADE